MAVSEVVAVSTNDAASAAAAKTNRHSHRRPKCDKQSGCEHNKAATSTKHCRDEKNVISTQQNATKSAGKYKCESSTTMKLTTKHRKHAKNNSKTATDVTKTTTTNSFLVNCERLSESEKGDKLIRRFRPTSSKINLNSTSKISKKTQFVADEDNKDEDAGRQRPTTPGASNTNNDHYYYNSYNLLNLHPKLIKLNKQSSFLQQSAPRSLWLSCEAPAKFFLLVALLSTLVVVILTNNFPTTTRQWHRNPIITAICQYQHHLNESANSAALRQSSTNSDTTSLALSLKSPQQQHYHRQQQQPPQKIDQQAEMQAATRLAGQQLQHYQIQLLSSIASLHLSGVSDLSRPSSEQRLDAPEVSPATASAAAAAAAAALQFVDIAAAASEGSELQQPQLHPLQQSLADQASTSSLPDDSATFEEEDEILEDAREQYQRFLLEPSKPQSTIASLRAANQRRRDLQVQTRAAALQQPVSKARGLLSLDSSNSLMLPQMQQIKSRFNQGCVGGTKCQFFAFCWMSGGSLGASCGLLMTCCVTPSKTEIQPVFYGPVVNDPYCGRSTSKISRIVGGTDASFGQFPWQAFVQVGGSRCGGALISSRHVVTAGHCVARSQHSPSSIKVTLGDYILNSDIESLPHEVFSVVEVLLHPNFRFTPQADRYDVAVLELDRVAQYKDNIKPICLPQKDATFVGRVAYVAGWGALQAGSKLRPKVLQHVAVPVIENNVCESWHRRKGIDIRIYDEMMCAGYELGQRDACQGDSGGPLMLNQFGVWYLVGIVSAGYSCAKQYQPGIYHRVSSSSDWISSNLDRI